MKLQIRQAQMLLRRIARILFGIPAPKSTDFKAKESGTGSDINNADRPGIISDLMQIETMLCMQADIAQNKYPSDHAQLLKILKSQHIGVENLLKSFNVECNRSPAGMPFDPETQEADSSYIGTDDPGKDGTVAYTICPSFWSGGKLIKCELVKLYNYKPEQ